MVERKYVLYKAMTNTLDAQLLADGLGGNVVVDTDEPDDDASHD
jgi:hypothetical protein